ncbi:Heparin and heparin-sulfate lyase precursor [Novipirellula aureliae]|uniref:Heparin and heparin-sulfate lyase n=1 Tax=Novipirellula aureliae TaxID=2527966 RepID=A0A5C6DPZ8_9BACT|nr:heparinase II/III family protein [Novipirellula aureliae]TWU37731.1 Heparin and heparin-sulfate lyase precursor [Novipirellula aureliae]
MTTVALRFVFMVFLTSILTVDLFAQTNSESVYSYPPEVTLSSVSERIVPAAKPHPRLFADSEKLARLADLSDASTLKKTLADAVVQEARYLDSAPPITRRLEGRRLLGMSRRCLDRVITLSTAYYLTGDSSFVRRCEKEMLAAAAFSDWNPSHYLDVAEMTLALAIGYDWLYDELSPESRQLISSAIVEKGVELPWTTEHNGWVRASNNWGQVCHAGMVAGALAIMDDYPELAAKTVHRAITNVPNSMRAIAPKGSYPEGPGYWAYGIGFNVLLIDALESVMGTDFGLSKAPGFAQTGNYPALVTGPSGLTFNYADGGAGRQPQESLFWFASRYDSPECLQGEALRIENFAKTLKKGNSGTGSNRLLPLALLWMNGEEVEAESLVESESLPLHFSSDGSVPITIHRSDWSRHPATFMGTKAGSPSANHGQMDIGSFVLDADGVRWAVDLGAEGYHGIEQRGMNLWSRKQDSDRWKIFRQRNEGHNTLVINEQLQNASGFAKVIDFSDDPNNAFTVMDLTDIYRGQAKLIHRRFEMAPNGIVTIKDIIKGILPGSKVRWGMVTYGKPTRSSSSDVMHLAQKNKTLRLKIESPTSAEWQTIDTATPHHEWDSPNPGTQMVAFEAIAPESGELSLVVELVPGSVK